MSSECHLAKVDVEGSNPFSRSGKTATYRAMGMDAFKSMFAKAKATKREALLAI